MNASKGLSVTVFLAAFVITSFPDVSEAVEARTRAKISRMKSQFKHTRKRDQQRLEDQNLACGNMGLASLNDIRVRNTKIEVVVNGDIINAADCR